MLHYLKQGLKTLLIWLAVALFIIEEVIWVKGQQIVARVFAALHITWFLQRIPKASKWESLAWMSLPFLVVLPFKLAAVALFSKGYVVFGVLAYVGAKITSTALVGRIYSLAQAKLRLFILFDWAHVTVSNLNTKAKAWLHVQPSYVKYKTFKLALRDYFKSNEHSTLNRAKRLFRSLRLKKS